MNFLKLSWTTAPLSQQSFLCRVTSVQSPWLLNGHELRPGQSPWLPEYPGHTQVGSCLPRRSPGLCALVNLHGGFYFYPLDLMTPYSDPTPPALPPPVLQLGSLLPRCLPHLAASVSCTPAFSM